MTPRLLCLALVAAFVAHAQSAEWKQAAQKLYAEGRFDELQQTLAKVSAGRAADPEVYCLMGLVELRQGRLPQAKEALQRLQRLAEGSAKEPLAARLAALIGQQEKLEPQRQAIRQALLEADESKARGLIRAMDITPFRQAVLEIYLDLYSGRFVPAESRIRRLSRDAQGAESAVLVQLEKDLSQARAAYSRMLEFVHGDKQSDEHEALQQKVGVPRDTYLDDYFRRMNAGEPTQETASKILSLHMQRVGELLRHCPLDEFALDMAFNLALLTQKYEDLEPLGDRILARKGTLRIVVRDPGNKSYAALGSLVIDVRTRELYPALPAAGPSFPGDIEQAMPGVTAWRLPFDRIKAIDQDPRYFVANGRGYLKYFDGRLIRFNGQYAFGFPYMHYVFADAFGELASRQVANNLGRFVAHAVNLPEGRAKLAKVKVGGGSGLFGVVMAIGAASSAMTGDAASAAVFTQAAAQDRAEQQSREAAAESTLASWTQAIGSQAMMNLFRADFAEMEALLQMLQ